MLDTENMVIRLACIVFLATFSSYAYSVENESLVSIRQDFSGTGAHTWELMLKEDGSVVEEQYNIDAADIRSIEVIKVVRNVGQDQVHSLVAEASELMKSLPENVDERIYVDPETKVIRVSFDGRKLFSGWSSYETTPASSTTEDFERVWNALRLLLLGFNA